MALGVTGSLLLIGGCADAPPKPNPKPQAAAASEHTPPTNAAVREAEELAAAPGGSRQTPSDPRLALQAAMNERDPHARVESLEALAPLFGGVPRIAQMIAALLVESYANLGELESMKQWARRVDIRENISYAGMLNAMAYAYAEAKDTKDSAEGLIRIDQALAILDRQQQKAQGQALPPSVKANLEISRAAFLDTRAWLHFRRGEQDDAATDIDAALLLLPDGEIFLHRCKIMLAKNLPALAAPSCARAALELGETVASTPKGTARDKTATLKAEAVADLEQLCADPTMAIARARQRRVQQFKAKMKARGPARTLPSIQLIGSSPAAQPLELQQVAKGQTLIFWLWATWCKPCLYELPLLESLAKELAADPSIHFLAINVDEDPDAARRFLTHRPIKVPLAFGKMQTIFDALDVNGLPALFIRDAEGQLLFTHLGASPDIRARLKAELELMRPVDQTVDLDARCAPPKQP